MRTPEWYVVQVQTGRERQACEPITRACHAADELAEREAYEDEAPRLVEECFSPQYRTQVKLHGEWHDETRLLIPGYVVAVTREPWRLVRVLRGIPDFTKLLTMGETFVPLSRDDRGWIERWTTEGDRTIPMSVAHKEGDRIVVTDGPLAGQEAMITRVNRRKNLAYLEIHAGALTIHTTVGLGILPGD